MTGLSLMISNIFRRILGTIVVEFISFSATLSGSLAPLEYSSCQEDRTSTVAGSLVGVDHGLNQTCDEIARAMNFTAVLIFVS